MAQQHQPNIRAVPPAATMPRPIAPAVKAIRTTPIPIAGGATSTQPNNESSQKEIQRELERQDLFKRDSNKAMKIPNCYIKVAALILRWDESIDEFPGHTDEIKRLQRIFEQSFRYQCTIHSIRNNKKPQLDLNMAILGHIREHDGPNSLLIIVYTGHGSKSHLDGRLELAANQDYGKVRGGHLPVASWYRAEEPLRCDMEGDALAIMDCCMASSAAKHRRGGPPNTYQLLAASAEEGPTCEPGPESFTTALCESLEELLKERDGGSFPVPQLVERINLKRKFQPCVLWDRLKAYNKTIQLERLGELENLEDSMCTEGPEKSSLELRLSLGTDDLRNDQISKLAEQLPQICSDADIHLRRVDWVRMATSQETTRSQGKPRAAACRTTEEDVLGIDANSSVDENIDDVYETTPIDFCNTETSMNARMRWRQTLGPVIAVHRLGLAVKRKHESEREELNDIREDLPYGPSWVMAPVLSGLLLIFGLLFFQENKIALITWISLVIPMVVCGPWWVNTWRRWDQRHCEG